MAPTFHARGEEHMLYPAEYGRYQFFKSQRDFINKLTDISEDMRHVSHSLIHLSICRRRLGPLPIHPSAGEGLQALCSMS